MWFALSAIAMMFNSDGVMMVCAWVSVCVHDKLTCDKNEKVNDNVCAFAPSSDVCS